MPAELRRLVSRLTLVAFFGVLVLPLIAGVHLSWNDDAACGVSELGPRHATAEFTSSQAPVEAGHCAVCHWMRAVSGATPRPAISHVVTLIPRDTQVVPVLSRGGQTFSLEQPSRAPPSSVSL